MVNGGLVKDLSRVLWWYTGGGGVHLKMELQEGSMVVYRGSGVHLKMELHFLYKAIFEMPMSLFTLKLTLSGCLLGVSSNRICWIALDFA